ncbi:MAG: hypothetical protein M9891_17315 [Austwickia sp.]|nr:hypothetical protein [Austwickia sp.]
MALNTPVDHCPDGVPQDWQPTAIGPSGVTLGHLTCAVSLGSRSDTEVVRWAAPAAVPATIGGAPVMSGDAHGIAVNATGAALVVSERWFAEPSLVTYVVGGGAQQRELMLDATTPVEGSDLADDGTVVGSVVTWDELGPAQRPVIASATASRPTLLPWPADQPLSYGTQNAPPVLISPDARLIVRNVAGGAGGAGGVLAWDAKRRPAILRGSEGFTAYDVNARQRSSAARSWARRSGATARCGRSTCGGCRPAPRSSGPCASTRAARSGRCCSSATAASARCCSSRPGDRRLDRRASRQAAGLRT